MKRSKEILFIAICIFLIWFITCDRESNQPVKHDSLKSEINRKKMDSDSIKFLSVEKDTAQKKAERKWKRVKKKAQEITKVPVTPCDSIIPIVINTCDSALAAKDSLIIELKKVIVLDSAIISNYEILSRADSLKIIDLSKSVKKEKRQKRLIVGLAVLIGIVGLTK